MVSNKPKDYLTILAIRQVGRRRDTVIAGAVFLVSFVSLIALGMLDRLSGRTLYLVATLVACFGASYLRAWMQLEIIKGSIELIDNLLLMNGA